MPTVCIWLHSTSSWWDKCIHTTHRWLIIKSIIQRNCCFEIKFRCITHSHILRHCCLWLRLWVLHLHLLSHHSITLCLGFINLIKWYSILEVKMHIRVNASILHLLICYTLAYHLCHITPRHSSLRLRCLLLWHRLLYRLLMVVMPTSTVLTVLVLYLVTTIHHLS